MGDAGDRPVAPAGAGPALFLLSASLLAFEIALLRVFSIESYHHFAYMAVGVALLGFGASGTVLVVLRPVTAGREWSLFPWLLALTPPAVLVAPLLARLPEFDPTQLLWDPAQWWGLAAAYSALAAPFLVGAAAVALALQGAGARVGRLYAWNLAGSGVGALGVLPLLVMVRPDRALSWTALPVTLAAVAILVGPDPSTPSATPALRPRAERAIAALLLAALATAALALDPPALRVIHFKGLPQVEAYPEARRLGEAWGPTGWAVAVQAPAFRHAPGLSLGYTGPFPDQVALFVDGEVAGSTPAPGAIDQSTVLEWLPTSAAYAAIGPASSTQGAEDLSVLVLGSGGGTEVLNALHHGAARVTAVELVEPLARLARASSGAASAYAHPDVTFRPGDARSFAARTPERYSLVVLPVAGVFNAAAAGVHSAGEDFLNTVEAYLGFVELLRPDGVLAVTHWVRTPARDNVRAILTAAEALRRGGMENPAHGLAFMRSWAAGTLLVKPDGFGDSDIERLRAFGHTRFFDLDWPLATGDSIAEYNRIGEPIYRRAAAAAAAGPDSALAFARAYAFDVRPATDDRPYFGRFLRLRSIPGLWRAGLAEWLPFAEWGVLGVLATLVQSALLALLLIGLPALVLLRREGGPPAGLSRSAFYFAAVGFGFILCEMALIQRLSLVLGHPVYAAAGTLGALLMFSGLGSAWSDRRPQAWASGACLGVAGLFVVFGLLSPGLEVLSGLALPLRGALAMAAVAVAGVLMGLPFPLGLRSVGDSAGGVAWAWAANGVASVTGAALAILLAMETGGRGVFLVGAACYVVAALTRLPAGSADLSPSRR